MRKSCWFGMLACILAGCDPGSGGVGEPDPVRLWKLEPHRDSVSLPSDSAGFRIHGDFITMYRRWNGCFRMVAKEKLTEFLAVESAAFRVDDSGAVDSLRVETVRRDTIRQSFSIPEMRVGCISETPIARVEILENGLDSASYSESDGISMTVDYDFLVDSEAPSEYVLSLVFYDAKGRYAGPITDKTLSGSVGRTEIRVEGWRLPRNLPGTETFTYRLELSYLRIARTQSEQYDRIFRTPLIPVKAVFR